MNSPQLNSPRMADAHLTVNVALLLVMAGVLSSSLRVQLKLKEYYA